MYEDGALAGQHHGPSPEATGTRCRVQLQAEGGGGQGCGAGGVKGREGHRGRGQMAAVPVPVALSEGGFLSLLLQGAEGCREEAGLEAEVLVMELSCDVSADMVNLNRPYLS